jgi:uncharacterized protein YxjI
VVTIAPVSADRFVHDRFLVDQLIRPIANLYRVTPLAVGETPAGGPIAHVRQKKLAVKEDIRFYADEDQKDELFRLKARTWLDTGGSRYQVLAADESVIGVLHHQLKSLVRSTWRVTDENDQELAIAQERSLPFAIARRVIDFGLLVGSLNRKFQLRDSYILDLAGDHERKLDRRLAIALAVGLDALQNR